MKKIILLLILLISYSVYPQWVSVSNGSLQNINDVFFIDANTGCAVGTNGLFIRSTNGGSNWSNVQIPITYSLNKIIFKSSSVGYACGDNGYILKTTNAGLNWSIQVTGTTSSFRDITFIDINTGMAIGAGGLIRSTTNGGTNWVAVTMPFPWGLTGISMNNVNRIYVSATDLHGAEIFLTTDFGMNWSQIFTLSNLGLTVSYSLNEICFVNDNTGFTVGSSIVNGQDFGNIYMTTNGGVNWDGSDTIGPEASSVISDIYFSSASTGTAVGSNGVILRTTNGGLNWGFQSSLTNHALYSVNFIDDFTGFACGLTGALIKTTNGGGPIGVTPISGEIPKYFCLDQNYPNPFNPTTKIKFEIPASPVPSKGGGREVSLKIYNVLGKEVASLIPPLGGGQEGLSPGTYEVEWNASNFTSGIYFYKLIISDPETSSGFAYSETKKLILLK